MVSSKGKTGREFLGRILGLALRFLVSVSLLALTVSTAFASGGACPTGANYINPANPTGQLVTLSSLGVTNCYYFSKSTGNDANSGTSESSPQAHVPGMPSYTGSLNPGSLGGGVGYILRGGDRWTASDFELVFAGKGSSGSPSYLGVDLIWYNATQCGASWCRPVFDCQGTQCGARAQTQLTGSYSVIDNIESTGIKFASITQKGVETFSGDHNYVERMYFHGWSNSGSWSDDGHGYAISANTSTNSYAILNVIDGSDGPKNMMGSFDNIPYVFYNVANYIYNGPHGKCIDVHGNLIENLVIELAGDHANMMACGTETGSSTNTQLIYNNVLINDTAATGAEDMWIGGSGAGDQSGTTVWIFNNITSNVGRGIEIGDHPPSSGGTVNLINNTINTYGSYCFGNGEAPPRTTVNYQNNHCIIGGSGPRFCMSTGLNCNEVAGTDLLQTPAQANSNISSHFDQYTALEAELYSPLVSTNSTVGAGNGLASSCTGNLSILCSAIAYPSYDATNHVVVVSTAQPRPPSGAWDIGAYQYSNGQSQPPAPPTSLTAIVQ